jgi:endonuclease-3
VTPRCVPCDFDPEEKGIYTIVLRLRGDAIVEVGSLGPVTFRAGWYAYTGSARGTGGFKRVLRHIAVMEGVNVTRRWHIDRLLPLAELEEVVATPTGEDLECSIARRIGEGFPSVRGFGSSDCSCPSHLSFSCGVEIVQAVREAHASASSSSSSSASVEPSNSIPGPSGGGRRDGVI